jgi:hypothetical protein
MRTSELIDQLAAALAAAQGEMSIAKKEGKSHFGKYATLENVWEAIRSPLSKNGLAIVQTPCFEEGRVHLISRIMHKSGQWIESELSIKPNRDDTHSIGSAISYLRRYSLNPLVGSVDGEGEDDGNAAMGKNKDTGEEEQAPPSVQKFSLDGSKKPKIVAPKPRVIAIESEKTEVFSNTTNQLEKLEPYIQFDNNEDKVSFIDLLKGKPFTKEVIKDVYNQVKSKPSIKELPKDDINHESDDDLLEKTF